MMKDELAFKVMKAVCDDMSLTMDEVFSKYVGYKRDDRKRARHIAAYILFHYYRYNHKRIEGVFNSISRSAIVTAISRLDDSLRHYWMVAEHVKRITDSLGISMEQEAYWKKRPEGYSVSLVKSNDSVALSLGNPLSEGYALTISTMQVHDILFMDIPSDCDQDDFINTVRHSCRIVTRRVYKKYVQAVTINPVTKNSSVGVWRIA